MKDLTEQQEQALGEKLVELFQIKKIPGSVDRYPLGLDHNNKTSLGIARTVRRLIEEISEK